MGYVWVPEIRPTCLESLRNQEKASVGRAQSRRETVIHVARLERQREGGSRGASGVTERNLGLIVAEF